ncbi:suppressor of cytokine signaling 3-like isoform X2 [Amblyomma americanum]
MVVGGRTPAEPTSCARASCSGPLCCRPCADVCAATLAGGGGMWSAQLRSPPPPGCGPDKQALFLVAFPICAAAAHHQQQPPPPPASSSCCRCCNCGWSAKPPSPPPPSWTGSSTPLRQDLLPPPALPTRDQEERTSSPGLRREEDPHHHHRMEAPPSPPLATTHGVGHQHPPASGAGGDLEADLSRLRDALLTLRTSGYYYEGLSWEEAGRLLRGCPVGTFLVRDSSDNRFLFALSVQTERGPTSVRIHYRRGQFRLDCEDALSPCMPWFPCVVSLVEHYVQLSRTAKGQKCVWMDCHGRRDLPIVLTRPLYRAPASLQHLCRIALNRGAKPLEVSAYRTVEPLPPALKDYLRDYPHLH